MLLQKTQPEKMSHLSFEKAAEPSKMLVGDTISQGLQQDFLRTKSFGFTPCFGRMDFSMHAAVMFPWTNFSTTHFGMKCTISWAGMSGIFLNTFL